MGDYAASGGYYMAMGADTIVALPTTITGSIGIFAQFFNFENFFKIN
jgi:protease-4